MANCNKTEKNVRLLNIFIAAFFVFSIGITGSCDLQEYDEPGALVPLTADEDPSLPSISIDGTLLHSETYGNPDSTMIVMLHGGPGGDYRSLLKARAFSEDGYYVVFYDQRGSGLSRRHNADVFTIPMFINELDAVIEYYRSSETQKVVLAGQSWGAMLATAYVNQYPDKIAGLILTEPGGFTWEDTEDYISRSQSLELFAEASNNYVYLDQFFTGHDHRVLDYKAMLRSASDTNVGNPELIPIWRSGAVCSSASLDYAESNPFDFTTNLDVYETEVLFGYSELNEAYGRAHAELVSSAFPNIQLVKFEDTGHSIPYFSWERYHEVALSYLNTIK